MQFDLMAKALLCRRGDHGVSLTTRLNYDWPARRTACGTVGHHKMMTAVGRNFHSYPENKSEVLARIMRMIPPIPIPP
jgi:hypothetical protein